MNRLFRVLHRWKCRSGPQRLALDALRHLGDDSSRWPDLFLWHVEPFLRGVDAPEAEFRDYANHVLYPINDWGGAGRLARKWYWTTVEALRSNDWNEAAFAAGVLSRYVTFPFSPQRTGHDETGLALRGAVECCVSRLYDELAAGRDPPRPVRVPEGDDWLERLLKSAAEEAHCHLRAIVTRFDFDAVAADPAALDDELKDVFTALLTRAAATAGIVLQRAIGESGSEPPRFPVGIAGLFALASVPLFALTRWPSRRRDDRALRAMHREFHHAGRLENTLPDSVVTVRDAYEIEVLKTAPRRAAAALAEKPQGAARQSAASRVPPRPQAATLSRSSPVSESPSIGSNHARFAAAGVRTIGDLLEADADELASSLHPLATAADVATWQDEAALCCDVPGLSPSEARLLVACGVTGPQDLAALSAIELWELVVPVAESPDGQRLLGPSKTPDLDAVTRWIDLAKRHTRAA